MAKTNKTHWTDNKKSRQIYKKHLKSIKEDNKKEREKLKKIKDFEKDEKVIVKHKNIEYIEKVIRVYDKSYKVSFNDDYILFNKESLFGIPNSIKKSITGDGRRFIGENCKLIKINK